MTCSINTIKNTQQSTSSGLMKETKQQRRVFDRDGDGHYGNVGITAKSMTVTVTGMTVMATSMTVMTTGMAVIAMGMAAHISCFVL
eukprot:13437890-Ditylum_brightwellii.AAC.1